MVSEWQLQLAIVNRRIEMEGDERIERAIGRGDTMGQTGRRGKKSNGLARHKNSNNRDRDSDDEGKLIRELTTVAAAATTAATSAASAGQLNLTH